VKFDEAMKVTSEVSSILLLQPEEARGLYDAIVTVPNNGLMVEVGCQLGRSSSLIAQLAKVNGFRSIHIDPYKEQPDFLTGWVRMMHSVGGTFLLLCMRTEQAQWYLEKLLQDGIDLGYIDGDHEAPGVQVDLKLVADRIKVGGLLAVHDYGPEVLEPEGKPQFRFPAVSRLIDEYVAKGWEQVGVYHTLGVWRRTA
jgi:predicted O-methyltransferase YrrM